MANEQIKFSATVPVDCHRCLRMGCPNCGLDFKLDVSEQMQGDLLAWHVDRILRTEGIEQDGAPEKPKALLCCPYCAYHNGAQAFVHPEHERYLHRLIFREFVEPMFHRMFDSAFGGLQSSKHVKIERWSAPRRPRPLVGPESGGMARIRCLACRALFKIDSKWRGELQCPECEQTLQAF